MAGYSGTPLPKKLGIKEGFRVALLNAPAEVKSEIASALKECSILKLAAGSLDFVFLFAKTRASLEADIVSAAHSLAPAGMLWISWPKKSSGVASDLDESIVRRLGLDAGLVDIKVCAVTDIWSGLKLVIPVKDRPKAK
ncbi:MAG TPA: hypothetical protein VMI10_06355 [Terriglobales bacterium]|nr:hypothetical protein [Terriglobales bacterium]